MASTISSDIQRFLADAASMDTYLFIGMAWTLWLSFLLLKMQRIKAAAKMLVESLRWSDWIAIPLALTVLAPFVSKPVITVVQADEPLKYALPALTFFLGDLAARRRADEAKEEAYRQLLAALSVELKTSLKVLKANYESLNKEAAYIVENRGHLENTSPPKVLTAQPNTRAIEAIVVQAQSFLHRDRLFGKANYFAALLKELNHLLATRRPLVASLTVAHPVQGSSSLSYEQLKLLDDEILDQIFSISKGLYGFLLDVNEAAGDLETPVALSEVSFDDSGHIRKVTSQAKLIAKELTIRN